MLSFAIVFSVRTGFQSTTVKILHRAEPSSAVVAVVVSPCVCVYPPLFYTNGYVLCFAVIRLVAVASFAHSFCLSVCVCLHVCGAPTQFATLAERI